MQCEAVLVGPQAGVEERGRALLHRWEMCARGRHGGNGVLICWRAGQQVLRSATSGNGAARGDVSGSSKSWCWMLSISHSSGIDVRLAMVVEGPCTCVLRQRSAMPSNSGGLEARGMAHNYLRLGVIICAPPQC